MLSADTFNFATGLTVPIPTFLLELTTNAFPPTVRSDEKRFVEEAVVEKKFVVVAWVPVAFLKVKFWRVDDALARRPAEKVWRDDHVFDVVVPNPREMVLALLMSGYVKVRAAW